MNSARILAAAALLAATGATSAADSAMTYGRDGGATWTQGIRAGATDTQRPGDAAAAVYGRAGRPADMEAGSAADVTMSIAPGRQGRWMSIDEVRG
jgi:hypothetical protein